MNKRSIVDLTADERAEPLALPNGGVAPARRLTRARLLLPAGGGGTEGAVAAAPRCSPRSAADAWTAASPTRRPCGGRSPPGRRSATRARATVRKAARATVRWRFTVTDARTRLHRLDPA